MEEQIDGWKSKLMAGTFRLERVTNWMVTQTIIFGKWKWKWFSREGLWKIIERKVIPNDFPTIIRSSFVIKKKFCAMKANADLAIVMFVKDKFFKLVESLDDPTDQWIKLAQKSKIGDTS
jgi:hypothetical protein